MKENIQSAHEQQLLKAASALNQAQYVLRLYITGANAQSSRAIVNIRKICEEHLKGRYVLDIIDISQHPELARSQQIIAAPTLIKELPLPLRRFIGNMSQTDRLLIGLDIIKAPGDAKH